MQEPIDVSNLTERARGHGLVLLGLAKLGPLEQDRGHLQSWQEQGFAGDLQYMKRPASLYVSPEGLLQSSGTLLACAVAYDRRPRAELREFEAKVARYAWGRDYHKVLKKRLLALAHELEAHLPPHTPIRVFTDAVPLLERAYARSAGLGFVGKNTLLISPRIGSFTLLGEILVGADLKFPTVEAGGDSSCGACSRCQSQCPTGALVAPFILDSRLCISYLTIEKRGMLTELERQSIGDWVFGCDICQDVCPFNHGPLKKGLSPNIESLGAEHGAGSALDLSRLFEIRTEEDFLRRFAGTPLMRAKREGLLRNGIVVAVNRRYEGLIPRLRTLATNDASPVVRAHAWWALHRLSPGEKLHQGLRDSSALVTTELARLGIQA